MLSGLTSAFTYTILIIIILLILRNNLSIKLAAFNYEALFFFWCLLTLLWSVDFLNSFKTILLCLSIVLTTLLIIKNIDYLKKIDVNKAFISGIILALIGFIVESANDGFISRSYRSIFGTKNIEFNYYLLDRGCALLSVSAWVVIAILLKQSKHFAAVFFYLMILYLLSVSDSLASFIAFIFAGFFVLTFCLLGDISFRLVRYGLLTGSICFVMGAYYFEPMSLIDQYNFIPDSAKHRLLIWHYVAAKAMLKPLIGFGLNSSKFIGADQFIIYEGLSWPLLPCHPHNNILQIWLETGFIGLSAYLISINAFLKKIAYQPRNSKIFSIVAYGIFINYYLISMISFNMWQLWWVCSGAYAALMLCWCFGNQKLKANSENIAINAKNFKSINSTNAK